jgi:uncharacterized protein (DUF433 family)
VTIDPGVHHGDPCIKGTRIPVSLLVGSVADGFTPEEIAELYPTLTADDVRAALSYAAELVGQEVLMPLSSSSR